MLANFFKYLSGALLSFIFITQGNATTQEKKVIQLYVLAGQSNMQGYGQTTQLEKLLCALGEIGIPDNTCYSGEDLFTRVFETITDYYRVPNKEEPQYGYKKELITNSSNENIRIHQEGILTASILNPSPNVRVINAQYSRGGDGSISGPGITKGMLSPRYGARTNKYGPELTLGTWLGKKTTDDIVLLKVVQGGSDLYEQWRSPSMALRLPPSTKASLYPKLIAMVEDVRNNLKNYFPEYTDQDLDIQLKGFFWFQGWNDSVNGTFANGYEENLKDLITDFRQEVNNPLLPTTIGQSHNGGDNGLIVQQAQKNVAESLEMANYAITNDLTTYFHYDSAAHIVIGERLGRAMSELLDQDNYSNCVHDFPCNLKNNESYEGISSEGKSSKYFSIEIPSGQQQLTISTFNGLGDFKLFVKRNKPADSSGGSQCHVISSPTEKTCSIIFPQSGKWYVTINTASGYNNIGLVASFK